MIGRKVWAVAGGRIPFGATGREPAFTSHDALGILNAGERDAKVEITIYYCDRDPVGPYCVQVPARRMRRIRCNDLIDPEAMPLDTDYAAIIAANVPIVVQFLRQDTRQAANAGMTTLAFPGS